MKANVLLLMVDALRADRLLGADRRCVTPALDALLRDSTVFNRAFSTASMTTCCTSSILSGVYPFIHGIRSLADHRFRPDLPTLPEAFQAGGYFTWAEVTGPLLPQVGLNRGFDHYAHRDYEETLETLWTQQFLTRLRGFPRPWFGLLHLWELHHPRTVTPDFDSPAYGTNVYDRAVSSLDHQLAQLLAALPENTAIVLTGDHGEYLSPEGSTDTVARLKKSFKWIKRHVPGARKLKRAAPLVFSTVDRLGKQDNELYYHWLGHGFHVYDYLTHVPLVFHGPALFPANRRIDHLASHVDIFPTLVSAFDLPFEMPVASGIDLMPATGGEPDGAAGRSLYMEASGGRIMPEPEQWLGAIRTGQFKYVAGLVNKSIPEELYDLNSAAGERENVIAQHPDVAARLREELAAMTATGELAPAGAGSEYAAGELDELQEQLRRLGYLD
jgi:arylsulfatase A-like enzyme